MPEKLRRDAAANRERLLDAARELIATRGLDVSLNEVARQAGVGVGTAYRRFASKDELVDALFEATLVDLAALAEEGGENRASLLTLVLPLSVADVAVVAICLGVAAWAVLGRRGHEDEPARPALYLFGALLLTTTPVLAWYALPLVALAIMAGRLEWIALAVAGAMAYGGHGAYPATPVAYAAALAVVYVSALRRARRGASPLPPAPRTP